MAKELIWTLGASVDLQQAYNALGSAKGEDLLRRIDAALFLVRVFPESAPVFLRNHRRLLVGKERRYGLFYCIEGPRIVVSAVANLRQAPEAIIAMLRQRTGS